MDKTVNRKLRKEINQLLKDFVDNYDADKLDEIGNELEEKLIVTTDEVILDQPTGEEAVGVQPKKRTKTVQEAQQELNDAREFLSGDWIAEFIAGGGEISVKL